MQSHPARLVTLASIVILLFYIVLSAGTAHALRPWVDEGWHGAPAWSLAFRGYMGTPSFVEVGLKDIDRYTYWIMPIYPVLQAGWYRIFDFSLESFRALSVVSVLIGLVCWTLFFRRLTEDKLGALLFMALMACDYISTTDAGTGRPDAMSFAFQAGAFAAYLYWREKSLLRAVLFSQTLVVASGLTHPNGGMLSFIGVLWLVVYFDRRRIGPVHVAVAAIPYVAGAIGWGAYILQDPQAFIAQYRFQLVTRSQVLVAPWVAVRDEFVKRILTNMGLGGHSPGSSGPHYLKAVVFLAYGIGILGLLGIPSLRRQPASRVLLGLIALYAFFFTFMEGTKAAYYLIYFVYPLSAALVMLVRWMWRNSPRSHPLIAAGLAVLFVIQTGGIAYRIRRDAYHKEYLPAVAFLRAHAKPGDLIVGSHELGFTIGFQPDFVDDHLLGLNTGKWPDYIFVEEIYRGRFDTVKLKNPEQYDKLQARLAQYHPIYKENDFEILERRPAN